MRHAHIVEVRGGSAFSCPDGERVLVAMERSGASDIGVGCRGGGCGICKVRVLGGPHRLGKMSKAHVSDTDLASGIALACRLYPLGRLTIEVVE
jgi:ferredoxin